MKPLTMMEKESRLSESRYPLVSQVTGTRAAVQVLLQRPPLLSSVLDGQQMFPFSAPLSRERIGQTKRDKLSQSRPVKVRQVTALMPAKEAPGFVLLAEGLAPALFGSDELPEIFLLGLW
jgi:hypothetical protein